MSIAFWLAESSLHMFTFGCETSFLQSVFTDCNHEVWMRSIGISFLAFFSIFAHFYSRYTEKLNKELAEKNKFINNIFDSIQDGISILDTELNIIQTNHWMEKMYRNHVPLIGKKCYLVHQNRTSVCPWCPSVKTLDTGRMHTEVVPYSSEDGEKGWIYVSAFPMRDEKNNVIGVIEYLKNITELKKAEKNFKDAYNRAEFYKDLFAHDINNILLNILSSTELSTIYIDKPNTKKEILEFLSIIQNQVDRGSRLISNINTISKLEKSNKSIIRIDINGILRKCAKSLKQSHPKKKINIHLDFNNSKQYVFANELLDDVVENILNNAVEYNINSEIEITIKTKNILKNGNKYLKVKFIDNGIGIENGSKDKIFDRSNNEGRSVKGLGLGLSLVKKIVNSYNGHIWVENRVSGDYSKGSAFVLLIPTEEKTGLDVL
ncbi:MAG: PAS domain S-box protein [Promethearchaeota archaeon]|nr:MAG: PAS domain S-box protein [Candidatus Lokiarchaeota archaeon]